MPLTLRATLRKRGEIQAAGFSKQILDPSMTITGKETSTAY